MDIGERCWIFAIKTHFDGLLTFNDLEKNKHKRPKIWNHASQPISILADAFCNKTKCRLRFQSFWICFSFSGALVVLPV